jgi:hypothetical protein
VELYFRPELRSAISDLAAELAAWRWHRAASAAPWAFSSARPLALKVRINVRTFASPNKKHKQCKMQQLHCIIMSFKITVKVF